MNGLVLSGGGARAAYQAGVLSYIAEKLPDLRYSIITGVSAGAINAAYLASHTGSQPEILEGLSKAWCDLTLDRVFRTDAGKLRLNGARWMWMLGGGGTSLGPKVKGLVDTSPLRNFLDARLEPECIDENIRAGKLRALGLTAIDYATGQTVTFLHGADDVPTWKRSRRSSVRTRITVDHVMASAALPLIFPAIRIDGDYYGDGSLRQAAPLAPAIHMGADRLLAIGTRYRESHKEAGERQVTGYPPPAQILGLLFHTLFMDTLEADAERLEQVNRALTSLSPDSPSPNGLRPIALFVIRPSRDLSKMAEPFRDHLPRSLHFLLRGLGVHRIRSSNFLSYLMFEEPYINQVIELGYEDAMSQWPGIERFFAAEAVEEAHA